jgi:hypothetical protein
MHEPANIKRVGHFAVMTDHLLGKGHYGKVYMAYEIDVEKQVPQSAPLPLIKEKPLVCKVIDRSKLSMRGERMIKNEIANL